MSRIPRGLSREQKGLYEACFAYCDELVRNGQTIQVAVQSTIDKYRGIIEDTNGLEEFLFSEVTVYSEPGVSIVSGELTGNDWWSRLKDDSEFESEYWRRYEVYLRNKPSWGLKSVRDIDESTDDVMNALVNPVSHPDEERMGLVFGYVQSGKTAHYLGLINKAYDAGYKIIIVLTGIHNSLRSQTQSRIDEEVLGYETSIESILNNDLQRNVVIGVGIGYENKIKNRAPLQSVTTRDEKGDFDKRLVGVRMNPPYIIVTKKNATVLKYIIRYFENSTIANEEDGKKYIPADFPALIIDDEADQASVNTKPLRDNNGNFKPEYDPSTINKLIRQLLQMFRCRSYVGYTATPYANIFIDPKTPDNPYGSDLYPRDYIFRSPRAAQYIGAREFFGIDGDETTPTMPLYREIIQGAGFLGPGTRADDPVGNIPEDMERAIKYFLISTALRNCRGDVNKPNTMLIHVVRFVEQQKKIQKKVQEYYESLANFIEFGNSDIKSEMESIWREDYLPTHADLKQSFSRYMDNTELVEWDRVWAEVKRLVRKKELIVYSVNGQSTDSLIYQNHKGKPFNVIVIGGDKLSRGLTLEGLTVSYFTRASNTYDTLMQMGRWFGFRPGYLDACRLFTTQDLYGRFSFISMATEDLADQFDYMNDIDQTPKDFGLRVATHPSLLITSRNKLRTGMETKRDFSCVLSQTRVFDVDGETYDHNFIAAESLISALGNPLTKDEYKDKFQRNKPGDHLFWTGISAHHVASFFEEYWTSKTATRANSKYMAQYIRDMNKVGGVTDWTVCLINVNSDGKPSFQIGGLTVGAGIFRQEGRGVKSQGATVSIHTMTSEGHEYYDYTLDQINQKDELTRQYQANGTSEKRLRKLLRKNTRPYEKGLLLLYPIANAGELTHRKGEHQTPFGFAVVFPDRNGQGELKSYRMTDVAWENDNDEFYE